MKKTAILVFSCSFLLANSLFSDDTIVNQTPSSYYAYSIQPCSYNLGSAWRMGVAAENQGYFVNYYEDSETTITPTVTVDEVLYELSSYAGLTFIQSHGAYNGFEVEFYPFNTRGHEQRNSAYDEYVNQGLGAYIDKRNHEGIGYAIKIKYDPAVLSSDPINNPEYYRGSDAIVVANHCYAGTLPSFIGGPGRARCEYGPETGIGVSITADNANYFFACLDGEYGIFYRQTLEAATHECVYDLKGYGSENTTLAPTVRGFSHYSGVRIPENGLSVTWEFDTEVDINDSPHDALSVEAPLYIDQAEWIGNNKLRAKISTTSAGSGYARVLGSVVCSANELTLFLDGNGIGPAGDDYNVKMVKRQIPSSDGIDFFVRNGIAKWQILCNNKAVKYIIEGSFNRNGPWIPVSIVNNSFNIGIQSVDVSHSKFDYFRLIRITSEGERFNDGIVKSTANSSLSFRMNNNSNKEFLRTYLKELRQNRIINIDTFVKRAPVENETCVIFTDSLFANDVELYVAEYWREWGYNVSVVTVNNYPTHPDSFRAALKAAINYYARAGTEYFHLIGDANDWREFNGDLWETLWVSSGWPELHSSYVSNFPDSGQPDLDLIPTFAIPDTVPRSYSMSYMAPYWFTDQEYADTNSDYIPDVVITRWPVNTQEEVLALAIKMQTYNDFGTPGGSAPYYAAFYIGDYSTLGSSGEYARSVADSIEARMLELHPNLQRAHIYESDYSDQEVRNEAAADLWDTEPEIAIMISADSHRYRPGEFFNKHFSNFNMDMITSSFTPIMLAATCVTTDWAQTEHLDHGAPICEDFLLEWGKGAVAWLGPSMGSYQEGNREVGLYLVEELLQYPNRPMAMSWLIATQKIIQDFQDDLGLIHTVRSYEFLGDPLSRFNHKPGIPTSITKPSTTHKLDLKQNAPNPFNPMTRINYSISKRGMVTLQIFNVKGERVKVLVNEIKSPGSYTVEWAGKNEDGNSVSSGVYFYTLSAEGQQLKRKMILLK